MILNIKWWVARHLGMRLRLPPGNYMTNGKRLWRDSGSEERKG